jgi:hypothetical protein
MTIVRDVLILIVSIAIGFVFTFLIAESSSAIGGSIAPFIFWGVFTIIIAVSIRRLISGRENTIGNGSWGSPEQERANVINNPQFVGRLDREKGLLETTARMVIPDNVNQPSYWSQSGVDYTVFRLRGELLDQNGSPLEYIPVEIRAKEKDWVGNIVDGDRIRVEGKFESDGILHAERAFNFSTNSWVGKPR